MHGNAFALRAVLDDIRSASPDLILNLGDTVWGAADPGAAWALQAEFAPPSVRGNTDERVAGLREGKEDMRAWVRSQIPDSVPARVAALPVRLDVAGGEVRAAHGSPRSAWEDLMLTEEPAGPETAGRTRPARLSELRERLDGFTADAGGQVCVVGHTHREMLAVVDGVTVLNVGPVSRQKDGLPLARWALLTRRAGHWMPEFRRTEYDVAGAVAWCQAHAPQRVGDLEAGWLRGGREP
ncbi:metallophosphoesterase [Deinococcus sp.]|uniref:metallophosphoesterase family protein n=1 Tax=Deinococcus sp. TaxID=47478 RepID=UPI00345BF2A6